MNRLRVVVAVNLALTAVVAFLWAYYSKNTDIKIASILVGMAVVAISVISYVVVLRRLNKRLKNINKYIEKIFSGDIRSDLYVEIRNREDIVEKIVSGIVDTMNVLKAFEKEAEKIPEGFIQDKRRINYDYFDGIYKTSLYNMNEYCGSAHRVVCALEEERSSLSRVCKEQEDRIKELEDKMNKRVQEYVKNIDMNKDKQCGVDVKGDLLEVLKTNTELINKLMSGGGI